MTRKIALALICSLFVASVSFAGESYETSKHKLDNGMPVIITEMPGNPMVSVYCLVKAGAATEDPFLGSGISHFVEHMLFKSTEKRAVGQIAPEVQAMGGSVNASTSLDFTIYTLTVPADKFDEALDILADMVTSATFDPQETEKEREVIFREMDLHNDNPARRLSQLTFENVYIKHPYRHPTIGHKDLFANISRDDLYAYYKAQYIPNNMVFSVAGDVRSSIILPKIKERFKDFKRQNYPARVLEEEPDQVVERYLEDEFGIPYAYLSMAFPSVRLMDKDLYALDVLAYILGIGNTSRLFKDLYHDKELVYGVSASSFTPVDKGAFEVEATLEEENIKEVQERILRHIHVVQEFGVTKEELDRAKIKIRMQHVVEGQHTSGIAWTQALDEAFTGSYDFSQKYVDEVAKVTSKDIQRVAQQYLNQQSLSITVLKPKKEDAGVIDDEDLAEAPPINKYILDNGLTVLLRQNPKFPLVAIRMNMEGGSRQEDASIQGASSLSGSLWIKGTKKKDQEDIHEFIDARGIRLGYISGRNSLGLYLAFLPEYIDDALDLLAELIFTPTFPEEELAQLIENTKKGLEARDTDPYSLAKYRLYKTLFPTHPFGRYTQGTEESLNHIQQKDLKEYYLKLRHPQNMVITILGDINEQKVLARIKKEYGSMKKADAAILTFTENPIESPREETNYVDKDQAIVMFGFHGPTIYDEDYHSALVAGSILGSSFSGRMFGNIRDKLSKAYTLGGGLGAGLDAGLFSFYISTTDENVETVIELMKKEFGDLQENFVTDKELSDIKTYLKGIHKSGLQTDFQLVEVVSFDELYGLGFNNYKTYDTNIDAVTKEDIQRIARKYWNLNAMATVISRPNPKEKSDE